MELLCARPAKSESLRRSEFVSSTARLTVLVSLPLILGCLVGCVSVPQVQQSASTATVTTPTPPAISTRLVIHPFSLTIRQGENWGFDAAIEQDGGSVFTLTPEPASWSIQEGAAGGSITSDGVYTAPSVEGVYHVVGISKNDPTKTATVTVTVGRGLELSADPKGPRFAHTATLLPGGQVIVAGGYQGYPATQLIVDRADKYDPVTGIFQFVTNVTRSSHTATLLPNGDLLFLGGYMQLAPPVATATAEILRAGTGTIQGAGHMSIARAGHTATLLPNGLILVVGGDTPSSTELTSSAELYDPASGTSSPAGSMTAARTDHLATLLQNGKVLIVGSGSAELYDPATNSFTPTGSPTFKGTGGSTATLLPDGRVLVAGGSIPDQSQYGYKSLDTAELYDPATGQFAPAGNLTITRSGHTATLLPNGTVLIAGGLTDPPYPYDPVFTAATEIFDPQTKAFSPGHAMKTTRAGHTATLLLDGTVLFVGGYGQSIPFPVTEIFH